MMTPYDKQELVNTIMGVLFLCIGLTLLGLVAKL